MNKPVITDAMQAPFNAIMEDPICYAHDADVGHAEKPPAPDFMAMSPPDLLAYMSDDASKWAEAFCAIAAQKGHPGIDEGWMIGWFANAIEHSTDVRHWRGKPDAIPAGGPLTQ